MFFFKSLISSREERWKLLKKLLQLRKKFVVCMEDNCIFCSFVCSVRD